MPENTNPESNAIERSANPQKVNRGLLGAGVVAAIAASLCCITPVLAFLSGAAGLASAFSWMEPARPWLMALSVGILGFAWYQTLKPRKAGAIQCACEENEKTPFLHSGIFLAVVTVIAAAMMAFPYYGGLVYPDNPTQTVLVPADRVETATYQVSGMTCASCEAHVKHGITEVAGVIEASANYQSGKAVVRFDRERTNAEAIRQAIDATGYKVESLTGAMSKQSQLDNCCVLPSAGTVQQGKKQVASTDFVGTFAAAIPARGDENQR